MQSVISVDEHESKRKLKEEANRQKTVNIKKSVLIKNAYSLSCIKFYFPKDFKVNVKEVKIMLKTKLQNCDTRFISLIESNVLLVVVQIRGRNKSLIGRSFKIYTKVALNYEKRAFPEIKVNSIGICTRYEDNVLFEQDSLNETKTLELNFQRRTLDVYFNLTGNEFKIGIDLYQIQNIYIYSTELEAPRDVVLEINSLPKISKKYKSQKQSECEFKEIDDPTLRGALSRCYYYKIHFHNMESSSTFEKLMKKLTLESKVKNFKCHKEIFSNARIPHTWTGCKDSDNILELNFCFQTRYLLHCLCSALMIDLISKRNITNLINCFAEIDDRKIFNLALKEILSQQAYRTFFIEPWKDIKLFAVKIKAKLAPDKTQFQRLQSTRTQLRKRDLKRIKSCTITPLRVIVYQDELEETNRIIRRFWNISSNFLRVTFANENSRRLSFDNRISIRIKHIQKYGINIAGNKYVFLAYSNSQLKSYSLWFYDETTNNPTHTAEAIRWNLGDMANFKLASKLGSRIGQALSSSKDSIILGYDEYLTVPDIYDASKRCFSDGVGLITQKKAVEVMLELNKTLTADEVRLPSAFQIRFGGHKGVLSVWPLKYIKHYARTYSAPFFDNSDQAVIFRDSMKKFESNECNLEIVAVASSTKVFLNQPLITLLEARGMCAEILIEIQNNTISDLNEMFSSKESAIKLLKSYGFGYRSKQSNLNTLQLLCKLLETTVLTLNNTFLYSLLTAFRNTVFLEIQARARILVPKGVTVMGILDEANVLEYGEIYCSFTDTSEESGKLNILQGPVLVGRNPSLHPGDLRILTAVKSEKFSHLEDVIVFPAKGKRPHPTEMSGGDLDGDLYFIIFDDLFLTLRECSPYDENQEIDAKNNSPKSTVPNNVGKNLGSSMQKFILPFWERDNLGYICNQHKALADHKPMGANDPACLELADLFYVAVDFQKTGVSVTIPNRLIVDKYPDFMGKRHSSYQSKKALGKLYRKCQQFELKEKSSLETLDVSEYLESGYEIYLPQARVLCEKYYQRLYEIMKNFYIFDEGEVMSGFSPSLIKGSSKKHKSKLGDLRMKLNMQRQELQNDYQEIFYAEFKDKDISKLEKQVLQKASAWYKVSSEQEKFHSFFWIVAEILLNVFVKKID